MMKQKLLGVSTAVLIGMCTTNVHAFGLPSFGLAGHSLGFGLLEHYIHLFPECVVAGPLCIPAIANAVNAPWTTIWFDLLLNGITALDLAASFFQEERTIDASEAIKKLEKALKGNGGSGSGGGGCSGDASIATVYTADYIMSTIETTENKTPQTLFDKVRTAVKEYVFETPDPDINGNECGSDKDCAVARQDEWLLASLTLASATADKVLDQTAKKNLKDTQTAAEKSEDDQTSEGTTQAGGTPLTGHFASLAANFNAATSPMDLYNAMANIVLDTHRQANDANALMGRDLEAQGLRIINETGPELLTEAAEEE